MKKIILSLLFLYNVTCMAEVPDIGKLRLLYRDAAQNEQTCRELKNILLNNKEKPDPLLLGYKASATMMMAGYVFNPLTKLSYFKKGRGMLQRAIHADEKNVELRFLRFNIQTHIPFFLGYHSNIETDKIFLLNEIPQLADFSLKNWIISDLKKSDYLTDIEKKKISL
ncbi:MAG: hypothetical protein Q8891_03430 [Bacteroidota bacterium]|nr:hypothetical protein [Bacteroidota bacterium]